MPHSCSLALLKSWRVAERELNFGAPGDVEAVGHLGVEGNDALEAIVLSASDEGPAEAGAA